MGITILEHKIFSSDSIHMLTGRVYVPEGEIRGLVQVIHGMTEYIGLYDDFMTRIAEAGFVCFGFDNLGHGYTAFNEQDLGFIAPFRGWDFLAKDVVRYADVIRRQYGYTLPYCLMGHSMGAFLAQTVVSRDCVPDKLILMGTGKASALNNLGILTAKIIRLICGQWHRSKLMDKMVFKRYNTHFEGEQDTKAWLSSDSKAREMYRNDPMCQFRFTISAMGDLIKLNKTANKSKFYRKTAKAKIPVLLVSGQDDPIGDFGKGTQAIHDRLKAKKVDVQMKLYTGCRHCILQDTCRDTVTDDIIRFINS